MRRKALVRLFVALVMAVAVVALILFLHQRLSIDLLVLITSILMLGGGLVIFCGLPLYKEISVLNSSLAFENQRLSRASKQLEETIGQQTCTLQDVEEELHKERERRISSESSLRISIEDWRRTFNAIKDPVLILDNEFTIIKGNTAAKECLTNESLGAIAGRKCHELFAGSDQLCPVCPATKIVAEGRPHEQVVEHSFLGKTFQVSCMPIVEDEVILGYVHTAKDITFRRNLEQKLVQAQKMEAIATLAGGIAHEFNNILGAILGNADLLLYRFPQADREGLPVPGQPPTVEEIIEHVTAIKRAGMRAKDLVSQILAFSRQTSDTIRSIQVAPIIKEGVKLLRSSLPTTIDIEADIASGIGPINMDPTRMHQVLMNLATNAAQALGKAPGRISVGLEEIEAGAEECARHHDLLPGRYIVLTVKDTGHGIPKHLIKRVFDPFFSTRDVGVASGMGLAVIHGIVIANGGVIEVDSEEGKGTKFTLFFPRIDKEKEEFTDVVTNMARGTETILFVDDEEDIVTMRSRMLEYLGYKVLSASSGVEALKIFSRHQGVIDLVITDQTMPKMTGLMLAEKIGKIDCKVPIILCSGYSEAVTIEEANRVGIRRFLAKPLEMRQLAASIRELLSRGKA